MPITKLEGRDDSPLVLAIDPALSTTGYAVLSVLTKEIIYIDKYCTSTKLDYDKRVDLIVTELFNIAVKYGVSAIALEDGFVGTNLRTACQLAELRGSIGGVFSFNKYPVCKLQPSYVRKAIGCSGNASKMDVAMMLTSIYSNNPKFKRIGPYSDKQNKDKTSDMYDALGIGVAYCTFCLKGAGIDG